VARCPVMVRDAEPEDVHALRELLATVTIRGHEEPRLEDELTAIANVAVDPEQRLVVAVTDGDVVGVAHLKRATLSPLQTETAVYVLHLNVREDQRRHGVGHALLEATVSWAEEKDSGHVIVAATASSRDTNRFMARLGLGQAALMRVATVPSLRSRLPVETPAAARVGSRSHRSVGQVLAQRRSLRRAQARTP
jgi:N-acetylglutamate synthase-like GNAT family acetyltransferase